MAKTPVITIPQEKDGFVIDVDLPARFEVCTTCQGRGTHDHPSFRETGITSEEWRGPDWDDDSRQAYLDGVYDVPCSECAGARVVPILDRARCTHAQLVAFDAHEKEEAEYHQMCRMERMMGA